MPAPVIDFFDRQAITDSQEMPDMTLTADRNDPIERMDPADPTPPIESTEPIDPIDRSELREPIDKIESCDHSDQREPSSLPLTELPFISRS